MPQRYRQQHIVAEPGSELLADRGEPLLLVQLVLAETSADPDEGEDLLILVQAVDGPANETATAGGQQELLIRRVIEMDLKRGLMRCP